MPCECVLVRNSEGTDQVSGPITYRGIWESVHWGDLGSAKLGMAKSGVEKIWHQYLNTTAIPSSWHNRHRL